MYIYIYNIKHLSESISVALEFLFLNSVKHCSVLSLLFHNTTIANYIVYFIALSAYIFFINVFPLNSSLSYFEQNNKIFSNSFVWVF